MTYDRSTGIGASEIAAVLGISPFQSAWEVYARKKGLIEPQPETERMRWGKYLQKAIAAAFSEQTHLPHRWCDRLIRNRKRKWQFASPDALVLTQPHKEILEVKNVALDQAGQWDWDSSNEDGVPDYYACQAHWLMSALGLKNCWVAALIGGSDFRIYSIAHDLEIEAILLEEGWNFVKNHLDANVAPPIDGSRAASAYLKKRFPRQRENIRAAAGAEVEWLEEYAVLRVQQDAIDTRRGELENQIKEAIGDAEGLEWPRGKFTWKLTRDHMETDWEALARSQLNGFTEEEKAAFLEQFTHVKHGSRRIYFRAKEIPPAPPIPIRASGAAVDGGEQFGETTPIKEQTL